MCMRASEASELRRRKKNYILKLLFLSIFCRYIRYFVGTNDMLVGLHVPTNFPMYRQISKCTDKSPKRHYWGGGQLPPLPPPPPPPPPLATLMSSTHAKHHLNARVLDVPVPNDVEALWLHMRPCTQTSTSSFMPYHVCCLLPPRHPNAHQYIDHLLTTIDSVLLRYPEAGITLLGDFNDLDVQPILNNTQFKHVVSQATRGTSILDKIITTNSSL